MSDYSAYCVSLNKWLSLSATQKLHMKLEIIVTFIIKSINERKTQQYFAYNHKFNR